MELLLNTVWLLIAAGALACWRIVWKQEECHSRRSALEEWTAFTCALVFIFFAVSLSDDLHEAMILSDDLAGGRHHALICDCSHGSQQQSKSSHAPVAAMPSRATLPLVMPTEKIGLPAFRTDRWRHLDSPVGRAPPVSLL